MSEDSNLQVTGWTVFGWSVKNGCSKENIYTADELWIVYNMTTNAVFTFKCGRCDYI
jgi:hypothetical protein